MTLVLIGYSVHMQIGIESMQVRPGAQVRVCNTALHISH